MVRGGGESNWKIATSLNTNKVAVQLVCGLGKYPTTSPTSPMEVGLWWLLASDGGQCVCVLGISLEIDLYSSAVQPKIVY